MAVELQTPLCRELGLEHPTFSVGMGFAPGMVAPDFEGDPEYAPFWAGESCGVVNDVKPAAAIVRDLVREAAGQPA